MSQVTRAISLEAQAIANRLEEDINRAAGAGQRIGFTLLIYTPERASYIGNVARADAIREMKNLLAIWEADMPDIPAHEFT